MTIMEGSPGPITPTLQQDELFHMIIRNFVNTALSHRQVLADSWLSLSFADVDKWVRGEDLPELSKRPRILDFIWTHYSNCKCS